MSSKSCGKRPKNFPCEIVSGQAPAGVRLAGLSFESGCDESGQAVGRRSLVEGGKEALHKATNVAVSVVQRYGRDPQNVRLSPVADNTLLN